LIDKSRELPVDGFVFRVFDDAGAQLMWEMWGDKKFEWDQFQQARCDLKQLKKSFPKQLYLRLNVSPGKIDWFDDQQWKVVLHNVRIGARLAELGGCRGIMFDSEQYVKQLFNHTHQARKDNCSQAQYQQRLTQCGCEFMQVLQQEISSSEIILTFGYYTAQPGIGDGRPDFDYQLLAGFLDGMRMQAKATTRIIDGWEYSYDYKTQEQFQAARSDLIQAISKVSTFTSCALNSDFQPKSLPADYHMGFGLWLDYYQKRKPWNVSQFDENFFTPEAFETSLNLAMEQTDEIVWIYSGEPNWWTGDKFPQAYRDAIQRSYARKNTPLKAK
jgi:hypothetical protein